MSQMTGGQAIVAQLLREGVDTVFGLPGAQTYGLFDALQQYADRIRLIVPRHEQACGYMAMGYARVTGRPGVFSVVPGPGILNASAALLTALGVNSPVLAITGQVPSNFFGRGRGHLHEMPDQLATMRGFTKSASRIEGPATAAWEVARAFQTMRSGRPGPVALEMFWDAFTRNAEVETFLPLPDLPTPLVDPAKIYEIVEAVTSARAPMIIVGSGAVNAAAGINELAELLDAPVVSLRNGRGIVDESADLGHNVYSGHKLWPDTDLLIAVGTRLEILEWRWSGRPTQLRSIRIDIDEAEFRRYPLDINLAADSADAISAILEGLRSVKLATQGRREASREAKKAAEAEISQAVQPQYQYLQAMRDVLPKDGIIVDDLSQVGFASWFGFPVHRPRTYIQSGYQGTLGSGYGTALGAKVGAPDKMVLSFCGDGGFMFAVQELATAAQYNIALPVVVFNNSSFANVRRDQTLMFDGRVIGADLNNPDLQKLAESFGVRGTSVGSPDELRRELERAFAEDRPNLIEVRIERGSEGNPWPFIHPRYPGNG